LIGVSTDVAQRAEDDRVNPGRLVAEEERPVGHDLQDRVPVAQRRFDDVLVRVAQDILLPQHVLHTPAHEARDQRADDRGYGGSKTSFL
jgi:hypothetical protein